MRPRSGFTRPAIMLTIEVLPEPEGPNSAVTRPPLSNCAAIEKVPSCFSTSTMSMSGPVEARAGAAREIFGRDQGGERNGDRDHDEAQRRRVAARHLGQGVDRGRDGLRF